MKTEPAYRVRYDFKVPDEPPAPGNDWRRVVFWMVVLALILAIAC